MELVVRAIRCPPPESPQALHARFDASGGRIGRSNTCSLQLPSPDRTISREHLEIRCRDGRYALKVISKVNGCSVNDSAVPPGAAVELVHGDSIQLGDYLLVAEMQAGWGGKDPLEADPSGTALGQMLAAGPSPSRAWPSGADTVPGGASRFGRDDHGASVLDAFLGLDRDLLGKSACAPMSDQAQGLFRQPDHDRAMPAHGNNMMSGRRVPDAFDDDIFSTLEPDFGVPRVAATVAPVPATPARQASHAPVPVAASARSPVGGSEALAVLTRALQLDPGDLDGAHALETLRIVGELLKLTVDGLYQMLEMRAQLKNELRIEDRTTTRVAREQSAQARRYGA